MNTTRIPRKAIYVQETAVHAHYRGEDVFVAELTAAGRKRLPSDKADRFFVQVAGLDMAEAKRRLTLWYGKTGFFRATVTLSHIPYRRPYGPKWQRKVRSRRDWSPYGM